MPRSFRDLPAALRARFRTGQNYRTAFATPAGEAVLRDLYRFCGMGADQFVAGDPQDTAYRLGMRRVGLRIAAFLNTDEATAMRIAAAQETDREYNDAVA